MRRVFVLAVKSVLNRRLTAALTVLSVAVSVALLVGVDRIRTETRDGFANTISGADLIVGARGGPLNLLLYSVFRIGDATSGISWDSYQEIASRPEVAWTIPLSLGDAHRGYRVLGTTDAYFEHYRYGRDRRLEMAVGTAMAEVRDAVLGADVARALGYGLGESIVVSHGIGDTSFLHHDEAPFTVTGILAPTGTPVDRTVHVTLAGIDAIHADEPPGAHEAHDDAGQDGHEDRGEHGEHGEHEEHGEHGEHEEHSAEEGHAGHDDDHDGHGNGDEHGPDDAHDDHADHDAHSADHHDDHDAHADDHGDDHGDDGETHDHAEHDAHGDEHSDDGETHDHAERDAHSDDHSDDGEAHEHAEHDAHGDDHGDDGDTHDHAERDAASITAFIVGVESRPLLLALQRTVNEYEPEPLTAIIPGVALQQLWDLLGVAEAAMLGIAALVVVAGLIGMLTTFLTGLNQRRREMAVLRAVGAGPGLVFFLLIAEAVFLAAVASALGVVAVHAAMLLVRPLLLSEFGLALAFGPPGVFDLAVIVAVTVAGGLVAALPAWRAYRDALADGLTVRF